METKIETNAEKAQFFRQTDTVEWYSPLNVIESARTVMGTIDLDPASCEIANTTVRATAFFSKEDDGLSQSWTGNVVLNPPYGRGMTKWREKLNADFASGHPAQITALLPARTNAGWFQKFSANNPSYCFPKGGLRFVNATTMQPAKPAMFPSVVVYLGGRRGAFRAEFESIGVVICDETKSGQAAQKGTGICAA